MAMVLKPWNIKRHILHSFPFSHATGQWKNLWFTILHNISYLIQLSVALLSRIFLGLIAIKLMDSVLRLKQLLIPLFPLLKKKRKTIKTENLFCLNGKYLSKGGGILQISMLHNVQVQQQIRGEKIIV